MAEKKEEKSKKQIKGEKRELKNFFEKQEKLLPPGDKVLRDKWKEQQNILEKRVEEKLLIDIKEEKINCLENILKITLNQYLRVSADYANYQKRAPKQIADCISYEKEKIIKSLLPVMDNFEHTLQNAKSADDIEVVIKGVQIIYDQMLDILKSHDVEQIRAIGEKFDPALHQAMMQRAEDGRQEDDILEEFQKGYKLNGRVIRPTKVIVNKLPQPQQEKPQPEQPETPQEQ